MRLFLRFSSLFASPLLVVAVLYACAPSDAGVVEEVECYVRYLKPEGQSLAEMVVRRREQNGTRSVEIPGGVYYGGTSMQALASGGALPIAPKAEAPSRHNTPLAGRMRKADHRSLCWKCCRFPTSLSAAERSR